MRRLAANLHVTDGNELRVCVGGLVRNVISAAHRHRGKRINTDQRTGPVNVRDIVETGQSSLVHT